MKPLVAVLAAFAAADLAIAAAAAAGLRINTTASMPLGLYRVAPRDAAPITRGTVVAVCPPAAALAVALARNYLRAGTCPGNVEPFLKEVAAVAGDVVDVSNGGELVNGRALPASGRLARDCQGRPLAHVASGRYVVTPGSVWLYAPVAASWDSRYYGAAPEANVVGTAQPLVIVGRGSACS